MTDPLLRSSQYFPNIVCWGEGLDCRVYGKCDEEDEYDIPYYQTNREQSKEEFLSLPLTFKKEWEGTIFKAVESRILTTLACTKSISTNKVSLCKKKLFEKDTLKIKLLI